MLCCCVCAQLQGTDKVSLPDQEVLQQIAAYDKHPLLPASGSILAAMAAAQPAVAADSSGSSAAIVSLPGHADIEHSALAKSCCCCNKHEGQEVSNWPTWLEVSTFWCAVDVLSSQNAAAPLDTEYAGFVSPLWHAISAVNDGKTEKKSVLCPAVCCVQ
jgi:hypothetical protein